jgi:hypothetical protein
MHAGRLIGLDISVTKDGEYVTATLKLYPNSITVQIQRSEPYTALLLKIQVAILELVEMRHGLRAYTDKQFSDTE